MLTTLGAPGRRGIPGAGFFARGGRADVRLSLIVATVTLLPVVPAWALHPHIEFSELVHAADAIFVGTVTDVLSRDGIGEGMIVTDVTFRVDALVHTSSAVTGNASEQLMLTFAGGQVGDRGLTVSGVPQFEVGQTYAVFSRMDGQPYMNPLIGGAQGLFAVSYDAASGEAYPLTPGGLGLTGIHEGKLAYSARVERIEGGIAQVATEEPMMAQPGQPAPGSGDAVETGQRASGPVELLTLNEFLDAIDLELQQAPPAEPLLRGVWNTEEIFPAGRGSSDKSLAPAGTDGAERQAVGLVPAAPEIAVPQDEAAAIEQPAAGSKAARRAQDAAVAEEGLPGEPPTDGERAALCYCGTFNLFLTMEQVPTGWWEWGENNYGMALYNLFMDIYRYVADDGSFGNNNENEFGGYPSSQDLINIYGQGWNGELAVTWTFWTGCQCCTITQADIFFNPAYSWWQNFSETFNQGGRVLYRPVVLHELGHSWGMQRGSCTEDYSYSQISVMHAYYSNIVEDGYGIHHPEAYSIRRTYQGQTGVINRTDMGVESYYASGSLINSTTGGFYYVGDPITINNITVENNSNYAVSGVRLRFYLSSDNIISTWDYQMGSYWYWDSFSAETYSTGTYSTTVPNVPPGTYYVGAIISTGGDAYAGDDLWYNNATWLANTVQIAVPPPGNDWCYGNVAVGLGTYYGSTAGATADGSASCGFSDATGDVWYGFTAPCSGWLAVNTCGSSYDTVLSVHTGCYGSPLNELDCNDDCVELPCGLRDSCVTVPVTAGAAYLIRVSGYDGARGDFVLNLSYAAPTNDLCAAATAAYDGTTAFSNCGALTDGPNEPLACEYFGYTQIDADVWQVYTATCTGDVLVSLCGSSYDTKLAVYDGCPAAGGVILACNDDLCGYQSELSFAAVAGYPYWIRIGGYQGSTGEGLLTITCGGAAVLPGDLNCDGLVDFSDINPFVQYLSNHATWLATYPDCPAANGDCNDDGAYPSFGDINAFVQLLTNP